MRRVERLLIKAREARNDRAARVQGIKDPPSGFDEFLELLEINDLVAELANHDEAGSILDVSSLPAFLDGLLEAVKAEIESSGIIEKVFRDSVSALKAVPANRFDQEKRFSVYESAIRDGASYAVGVASIELSIRILDWLDRQRRVTIRDRAGLAAARRERARQAELKTMRRRASAVRRDSKAE